MKKNTEKRIAKAIWYAMLTITIMAIIFIFASVEVMVDAMAIEVIPFITFISCVSWLATFALFIKWANK